MQGNFTYANPTTLHFGQEAMTNLCPELSAYGDNILLVYGGGSIKDNGLYDSVIQLLTSAGKTITEDPGVMPNPTVDKLRAGIDIARGANIDFVLAVGGGSVVDYAKALAVGIHATGDVWERFFVNQESPTEAVVPMGCILTMAGTGSEMNGGSVITHPASQIKRGKVFGVEAYPKFAILNPVYTYTLPIYQVRAGIFDVMSHLMEQYFSGQDDNVSDYMNEGLMRAVVATGPQVMADPLSYDARANLMWSATWALNTLLGKGKTGDWMMHMFGHAIGGVTDATHGMALSAVVLSYYRLLLPHGLAKFKRFAITVWQVDATGKTDEEVATQGLAALEAWMKEMGLVMNSRELGVTEDNVDIIAANVALRTGGYKVLNPEEIKAVLVASMGA